MGKAIDLSGRKFGHLTAISPGPRRKLITTWVCICECGGQTISGTADLLRGHSKSCGCRRKQTLSTCMRTHGETVGRKVSREYATWQSMKERCYNVKSPRYRDYGERGVLMCERWLVFSNFLADMGRKPSDRHSIDRIDNSKGYSKENCRWATNEQQANNTRQNHNIEINGAVRTISEWASVSGVSQKNISARIRLGWPAKLAVFHQASKGNKLVTILRHSE
jgi:hypothetical protein